MRAVTIGTFPYRDGVATGLAFGVSALLYNGTSPYLPVTSLLHPYDLYIVIGWVMIRTYGFAGAVKWYKRWHKSDIWHQSLDDIQQYVNGNRTVMGSGFRWTGAHASALRSYCKPSIDKHRDLPSLGDLPGSPALHGVGCRHDELVTVPHEPFISHTSVESTTGSMKTALFRLLSSQSIMKPTGATVTFDPKGDPGWFGTQIEAAYRAGKGMDQVAVIAPFFPHLSRRINPLSTCTSAEQIAARLSPLFGNPQQKFFEDMPLHYAELMAKIQQQLGQKWTIQGLYDAVMIDDVRLALVGDYLKYIGVQVRRGNGVKYNLKDLTEAWDKSSVEDRLASLAMKFLRLTPERFDNIMSNYDTAMTGLADTDYSYLFEPDGTELTWDEIRRNRMLVCVITNSPIYGDAANKIGRLIMQDLAGYVGMLSTTSTTTTFEPLNIFIDEAKEFVYPEFADRVAQDRFANIRYTIAYQSISDLVVALGSKEQAERLANNFADKIYGRIPNGKRAIEISEEIGKYEIDKSKKSFRRSYGDSKDKGGNNVSSNHETKEMALVDPAWLELQPSGQYFYSRNRILYHGKAPLLSEPNWNIMRDYGYEEMSNVLREEKAKKEEVYTEQKPR